MRTVFVYRRVGPEIPLTQWRGPCGTLVQEKLLLPNHGRELAAFMSYVVEHYRNPPQTLIFLHGHGPDGYETDCSTLISRSRLHYRGLAVPVQPNEAAEFSKHMVTLTSIQ